MTGEPTSSGEPAPEPFPGLADELKGSIDRHVQDHLAKHPEADPEMTRADAVRVLTTILKITNDAGDRARAVMAMPAETRESAEIPAFPTHIVSFALPGLKKLREELGMKPTDHVIGVKNKVLSQYGLKHGDEVLLSFDGKTVTPAPGLRVVDYNENGPVVELRLTKPLRDLRPGKLRDHRENGTDGKGAIDMGDYVTYSVVDLAGSDGVKKKAIWIRVD